MRAIIFLRSYGDFTIAISVLRRANLSDLGIVRSSVHEMYDGACWKFFASAHLQPLYEDLKKNDSTFNLPIEFVGLGIKHKILAWFTNRYLFSLGAFREAKALNAWRKNLVHKLDSHPDPMKKQWLQLYLEQKKRAWLLRTFFGGFRSFVHESGNVYDSYANLFLTGNENVLQNTSPSENSNDSIAPVVIRKILILPESRKPLKEIPISFIAQIAKAIQKDSSSIQKTSASPANKKYNLSVAFYKNVPLAASLLSEQCITLKTHTAFLDLINLIKDADLVVTADSLPAHLSEFLNKPHFIYYAGKPAIEWLTPYGRKYNSFASIGNTESLLNFLNA